MTYLSPIYLAIFLPVVFLSYQLTPKKYRWFILLIASYVFYFSLGKKLIVFILITTIITYLIGLWLDFEGRKFKQKKELTDDKKALKKSHLKTTRRIMTLGSLVVLAFLVILKYSGFIAKNINYLFRMFDFGFQAPILKFAVPLGISFYTLQAISYLVDIYRGTLQAEKNIGKLGLYLAFFPTIMEGPIARYNQVAPSLFAGEKITYESLTFGMQRILWGFFKKLIIADRLNQFVKAVLDKPIDTHPGSIILIGAIAYTIQLYADFSGMIDMSLGTAEIFNVSLPENFRQPFFAHNVADFWKRWHISLGTWFKDYVFYPVMLSKPVKAITRFTKKHFGKHTSMVLTNAIALFAVWFCNGMWHGTGWNYILFGMYYFVLIVLGLIFEPVFKKIYAVLHINPNNFILRFFQFIKMFTIIIFGELIFRVEGIGRIIGMFKRIIYNFQPGALMDGSVFKLSLKPSDFIVVGVAIVVIFIVGVLKERGVDIRQHVASWHLPLRWTFYYAFILAVIIFGAYGKGYLPADIIYANF